MSNEALFFLLAAIDLTLVLVAFRLGQSFLVATVVANLLFTNMVSSKLVVVFGLQATVANPTYAAIFLATDLLSEHYGRQAATRAIWLGFFAVLWIVMLAPVVSLFSPAPGSETTHEALSTVFSLTPRIAIASLLAYVVANLVDVHVYEKIRSMVPSKSFVFLRNNGSTVLAQAVDQVLFVSLAFAGNVPATGLLQVFISGYLLKVAIAVLDTPFIYLSFLSKVER